MQRAASLYSGQHALGVDPFPQPRHVQWLVLIADGVDGLVPGRQNFPGGRVEVGACVLVPHRRHVTVEADDGVVRPPHLVVGRGQDPAQIGAGDRTAHGQVDVRGQTSLRFDHGEVLNVIAKEPPEVLDEPIEQRPEVQRVAGRPLVVVGQPGRRGRRLRQPGHSWDRSSVTNIDGRNCFQSARV